jgi:hypothetical protein
MMANLSIIGSPSTTNNNLIVNYSTDISDITNIEISNNGSNYISATTFSNSSAIFDVSSWKNGTYNSCTLRVTYGKNGEETQLLINNIGNITQTVGNSFYIQYSTNKAVTKHEVSWDGGSTFYDKTSDVTSSGNNYSFHHDDKSSVGTYRMAIRVTTSSGETVTSNIFTLTITSGVSTDTYYTVKYNLNNATSSNSNTTVKKGSSYSTTITPTSGYRITKIYCVMNGDDISNSTVNGNNINIPNVTGEINITVSTETTGGSTDTYYTIAYNLNNSVSSNTSTSIKKGSSYHTIITANAGHKITRILCTMGGVNIIDRDGTSGDISIANVSGDITISITTEAIGGSTDTYYTIRYSLHDATSSNSSTSVKKGSSYSTTISPENGYRITQIYCVMGGTDISSSAVNGNNVYIGNVTGDVSILVNTEATGGSTDTYPVTYTLFESTSTNSATTVKKGSSYSTTVAPKSGYRITKIYCVMGGTDVSSSTVSGNNINIPNVTGEIYITVYTEAISGTKVYTVTRNVTNCISTGSDTLDTSITTTFQSIVVPNDGYTLKTLTVSMGGVDYTDGLGVITDVEWEGKSAKQITIENVHGNIVINAVAERETSKPDIPDTPIVDDILEILPSCTYADIAEGGNKTIYFKLSNKPTSSTTINISSSSSYLTLSTSQLTFTADNYHIAQSVNVTSISDNNKTDDIYNITVSANGLTSKTITVDVIDSANSNFEVIYDNGTLVEGASFTLNNAVNYGSYISTNQSQDVSVAISNHPLNLNKNDKVHVVLGLGTSDPSSIYSLRSLVLGDGSANNISNSNMINEVQINEALSSDGKVDTYWTIAGNLSNITLTFTCYFARVNIYKIYIERGK